MTTHQCPSGDSADGATTTRTRRHSIVVAAFTLPLLFGACASNPATDQSLNTPAVSQQAADIGSESAALETATESTAVEPAVEDDTADYTDAELSELLVVPDTDEAVEAPDPAPLEAGSPEAAIEAIESELEESPAATISGAPILDQVQPVDGATTGPVFGLREGRRINEAGEAFRLDEAAALACGNVEIAVTALDDGRFEKATRHLDDAAAQTADTTVDALVAWNSVLDQAADDLAADGTSEGDVPTLLAFLTICTQGGYEL